MSEFLNSLLNECTPSEYHARPAKPSVIARPRCADIADDAHVRITAALLSGWAGRVGRAVYVGTDRIEVAIGEAVISFLPEEVEVAL